MPPEYSKNIMECYAFLLSGISLSILSSYFHNVDMLMLMPRL